MHAPSHATGTLPRAAEVTRFRLREAVTQDFAAMRDVIRSAYQPYRDEIPAQVYPCYLADLLDLDEHARHGQLMVAEVDGVVRASAAYYRDASEQGLGWPKGWAGGRGLAVAPQFRSLGLARALLAECERRARAEGAPVFAFHTGSFMTRAVALYTSLGFCRAPHFDVDLSRLYGVQTTQPMQALAFLRFLDGDVR